MKPVYEHTDQIGQQIQPGDHVAFAWSGSPGIRVGRVVSLTRHRVRIVYKWIWTDWADPTNTSIREWRYLSTPGRVLVLSEGLPSELTLLKLKGLLP